MTGTVSPGWMVAWTGSAGVASLVWFMGTFFIVFPFGPNAPGTSLGIMLCAAAAGLAAASQAPLLRRFVRPKTWIAAVVVGCSLGTLGLFLSSLVTINIKTPVADTAWFAIVALPLSIAEWLVLRKGWRRAWIRLLTLPLCLFVLLQITNGPKSMVGCIVGFIAVGALSAASMTWLLAAPRNAHA